MATQEQGPDGLTVQDDQGQVLARIGPDGRLEVLGLLVDVPTPKLVFRWLDEYGEPNDETCHVFLDGEFVATMDHEDHGHDGMVGIRDALTEVARIAGWTVVVEGQEGI